jgi:hypothetical protein
MPNWKKVIVSGSDATLNSLLVNSSIAIGTSSLGSSENTLVLGPPPAGGAGEGGQILLQASGGIYTSASMIDTWQNQFRVLRGTNASSDGLITQFNLHTKQMQLPAYTGASSFPGTATANLAVNSNGDVITVSTSGGSVFPYTGNAVITGSLTVTQPIYVPINGAMYFQGGDDAALYDINVVNTMGIYGVQDITVGSVKLGSNGGTISGRSGSIGIGTITPNSASLHVSGNVFATSFTGSILGTATTASYVLQAVSASFASTASSADNFTVRNTLTATTIVVQTITSSIDFVTGSTRFGTLSSNTHQFTGSVGITGSLTVVGAVSASNFTGSLLGTASFATSASWAPGGGGASFPYTGSAIITGSLVVTGSFDLGIAEFNSTSSATIAGTTIVSSYATASANSAFYNYYISSGSNARAGQIMSVWSGSTIQYTEVTTNDIGNTNTASFAVTLATGNVRLSFTAPGVWTVRSIVNLL